MRRVIYIVLDGLGVGALPDATDYGDAGSDTLGNLSRVVDLDLPFLQRMGLGNIVPVSGVPPADAPLCLVGRLSTRSAGKDTTVGHWEHMGLVTAHPFPTYPRGFPADVVRTFEGAIGRSILGNKPASGTAIIEELGSEHLASGRPIVYTSADSVFQIAAHTGVVPLEQLYEWCGVARDLLKGAHAVARVIARPFTGTPGAFVRTKDRRDFSLEAPGRTYLDALTSAGVPVLALGKIGEVFVGRGVARAVKVGSNDANLELVLRLVRHDSGAPPFDSGLLFTNLVDFDMVWGHRNDADGFARGLAAVDRALPALVDALSPEDLLVLTADHGVDPTTPSTDHSREYVPLLVYPPPAGAPSQVYEGTLADTGATVFHHFLGRGASPVEVADPGEPVQNLAPGRGWRRYTPLGEAAKPPTEYDSGSHVILPGRVGPSEAREAGGWLAANLGDPPDVAVILGSGLLPVLGGAGNKEVRYQDIPHWAAGSIPGHRYLLSVVGTAGARVALLQGRVHEYEGFDLSEEQLPVHTLAAWGVTRLILTSASGGVSPGLRPGEVLLIDEVLDFQHPGPEGRPVRLPATGEPSAFGPAGRVAPVASPDLRRFRRGVHASLPGPQYETPAELELLRALGVDTVSMSPAAELRAALVCGLQVAVAAVVANAGDTTHEEVLAGTARASEALGSLIGALAQSSA
jgi:phosphopentomutase